MKLTKVYQLSEKESRAIIEFIEGKLSSRQVAEVLGCSHQQALNALSGIIKMWYQQGKIFFDTGSKQVISK